MALNLTLGAVFKLHNFSDEVFGHTCKLTPAVLQASEMLGMYQAELASILGLQCGDIGRMNSVQQLLVPESVPWHKAILFMRLYQCLFDKYNGNEIAMNHWLRRDIKEFEGSPLVLMVDKGKLSFLFDYLSRG